MIGRTISHYTVLEKLGSGGMGDIYKAQDTRLNRFVAMKVLSTANAGDVERRRRFVQEAQAASALNHPNIITIHDVVSTDGMEFMVMEFVSGVTLDDLIPQHGLNVQKVLDCAVQMADALQTAHAAGIVHRDLKPGNVMVTGSGLVKILDFGIAKLTGPSPTTSNTDETLPIDSPMTVEGSILGTVCYMSPEQAQAKAVDQRSDIFSFGVVLYEMLTGKKAFQSDSALATLTSILRDEPKTIGELAEGIPPELEQIVVKSLRKDPAERWQNMQEMRAALLPLKQKSDSGVLHTLIGVPPVAAPQKKKAGMLPLVAAGGAIVVLAAGGGWWWMSHRPAPAPAPVAKATPPPAPVEAAPPVTPPVEVPPAETAMTNQNVIDMTQAKVPESTIIGQIRASKINFDLSTKGIIQLSQAGVKPTIINVMRNPKADLAGLPKSGTSVSSVTPAKSGAQVSPEPPPAPVAVPQVQAPPVQAPPPPVAPQTQTAPTQVHTVSINNNTPFTIALAQDVPLKLAAGQALRFTVSREVKVGNIVVIAKGTPVTGEVADPGDAKKLLIVKNKATFRLSGVDSAGGSKLKIRATPTKRADDKSDRQIELQGTKNKEILAPTGTEYTVYVDGDQSVTIKH